MFVTQHRLQIIAQPKQQIIIQETPPETIPQPIPQQTQEIIIPPPTETIPIYKVKDIISYIDFDSTLVLNGINFDTNGYHLVHIGASKIFINKELKLLVKIATNDKASKHEIKNYILYRKICDRYIAKFYCARMLSLDSENKLALFLEYYPSTISDVPMHNSGDYSELLFYIKSIYAFLKCIHTHKKVYIDLKPQNVCISYDGHVKMIDFQHCLDIELIRANKKNNNIKNKHARATDIYTHPVTLQHMELEISDDTIYANMFYKLGLIMYEKIFDTYIFNYDKFPNVKEVDENNWNLFIHDIRTKNIALTLLLKYLLSWDIINKTKADIEYTIESNEWFKQNIDLNKPPYIYENDKWTHTWI
jgi:serine/threonine protein kinase